MRNIDTIIIGGGQAGLAMSRSLMDVGIEHVILERGRVGERWRSERWDSLQLLTPRWQARLPDWSYEGSDPDGYMSRLELISYLERYAHSFAAPIEDGVTVTSVVRRGVGYRVDTDRGSWQALNVVIATGDCDIAHVPGFAGRLSGDVHQVVPTGYKNPRQLSDGGVLVVGASATGIQLAAEIHASGRPVTLAVGRHTRLPRRYRGKDILWWIDRMGIFDERAEDVRDLEASRRQPSLQLVGRPDGRSLDLGVLMGQGIRVVGRVAEADGHRLSLHDDLLENTVAADAKLALLKHRIDAFAAAGGLEREVGPAEGIDPIEVPDAPTAIDLKSEGIRTVLWATGYRRSYPWLRVPVLDGRGEIVHRGGITPQPGLYVLGLRFLRRRKSTFIDGAGPDAREIASYMAAQRERWRSAVA